ncbi:MAG: DUF1016 family protein [Fibrobacterota bacterium]|nr:MAG: DUF1016 family protein [Fibrobacterota bacterium]
MTSSRTISPYSVILADLKDRILQARVRAVRAVNRELVSLYWDIGGVIARQQAESNWGDAVVEQLSRDLRRSFPDLKGFSARNLWDMRRLHEVYGSPDFLRQLVAESQPKVAAGKTSKTKSAPKGALNLVGSDTILRQLVAEIPWGHHLLLMNKLSDAAARLYYLQATARFGWSRNVLLNQIKGQAFERAVLEKKTHNFPLALPEHLAEQADEMMKSSYNLGFLGLTKAVKERELEDRLITNLQQFLLELGYGFCFVGRQHKLTLGRKEYFVDLLFYHRHLKALVAFELKVGAFEPEHAGQLDFYLNLLNEKERGSDDQPSIGIILCAEKDDVEVEFALKSKSNPIGVAEYQLSSKLPAQYKGRLPTAAQLSAVVRHTIEISQD